MAGPPQAPPPAFSIGTIFRVLNVPVAIPSIAANSEATVSVPMPSMQPGDNGLITLAAGSTTPPATVAPTVVFCTAAGTALVKYVNISGGLTAASTATTITANFTVFW